jgi:hypothetical protein
MQTSFSVADNEASGAVAGLRAHANKVARTTEHRSILLNRNNQTPSAVPLHP